MDIQTVDLKSANDTFATNWDVRHANRLAVQVTQNSGVWGSAVVAIQGSVDGREWETIDELSATTLPKTYDIARFTQVRGKVSTQDVAAGSIALTGLAFTSAHPAHDLEELAQQRHNDTSTHDLYTAPTSARGARIHEIIVSETGGAATTYRLSMAQDGSAAAEEHSISWDLPIGANETHHRVPENAFNYWPLASGGKLHCQNGTANAVTFTVFGVPRT